MLPNTIAPPPAPVRRTPPTLAAVTNATGNNPGAKNPIPPVPIPRITATPPYYIKYLVNFFESANYYLKFLFSSIYASEF